MTRLSSFFVRTSTAVITLPEPAHALLALTGGLLLAVARRQRRA